MESVLVFGGEAYERPMTISQLVGSFVNIAGKFLEDDDVDKDWTVFNIFLSEDEGRDEMWLSVEVQPPKKVISAEAINRMTSDQLVQIARGEVFHGLDEIGHNRAYCICGQGFPNDSKLAFTSPALDAHLHWWETAGLAV